MTKRGAPRPRAKRPARRKKPILKKTTKVRLVSRTFLTGLVMASAHGLNQFAPGAIQWYATGILGVISTALLGWFAADEKTRT